MHYLIIDASVLITTIIKNNPKLDKKLYTLIKKPSQVLISSPLFLFETANGCKFSFKDPLQAQKTNDRIRNYPIKIVELSKNDFDQAIELAHQNKTSVYDSSYHQLALRLEGTFITCDQEYFEKSAHLSHIELWE